MKVLEFGKDGIVKMFNSHTGAPREKVAVYKGVDITGPLNVTGDTVELGYNETIVCSTPEYADKLFLSIAKEL